MSTHECGICLEAYTQNSPARLPRVLACGHSFCHGCLSSLEGDQKVKCPKCQGVSHGVATGYPINYDLLSSSSVSRGRAVASAVIAPSPPAASEAKSGANQAKKGNPEVKCAECQEKMATLFCHNSCGDLCDECSAVVHRHRINREHVVGNIADKPTPKRMCPEHKEQEALLYCMQCRRLACYQCGFGSHRNHGAVDVAEAATMQRVLVQQQCDSVDIAKLHTKLAEIGEKQKLTEQERLSIVAAIDTSSDRLREAVTARQKSLRQSLSQLVAAKAKGLEQLLDRHNDDIATLTQLKQNVKSLLDQDDMSVLDACASWLSAIRRVGELDQSSALQSLLFAELDASLLTEALSTWGCVNDLPPVQNMVFDQGTVSWSSLAGAVEYEVQMAKLGAAGERKGGVDVDVAVPIKDNHYRCVYQGASTQCEVAAWECGQFAVRARAKFDQGWGPFSSMLSVAFEFPPVCDVALAQGVLSWGSVDDALQYEVQMAGPIEIEAKEAKEAKEEAKEAKYASVYQGSEETWRCSGLKGTGLYRFRVRAQHDAGWGLFSQPFAFQHTGLAWDPAKKSESVTLSSDANGRTCVARRNKKCAVAGWHSVMSSLPLSPSPSSTVASYEVKMDFIPSSVVVGVSPALPPDLKNTGYTNCGVGWNSFNGSIYSDGRERSGYPKMASGDVVRVEMDFDDHTVSFFKNGVKVCEPIPIDEEDIDQPFYASVSLYYNGDQVTLL